MAEYEKRTNADGEAIVCDCCGYWAATMEFNGRAEGLQPLQRIEKTLCEVCASSYLSSCVWFPSQCPDVKLWKSIGWIANRILDEIRSAK